MTEKVNICLGYSEKDKNLAIRINAHKKFSNLSLEDWLLKHLSLKKGAVVLDIGCGNGNFFSVYSKKIGENGLIVGIDKSFELLQEARRKQCLAPKLLLHLDMNSRWPFIDDSFDYIISTFAIYYAADVSAIVKEIFRVLNKDAEVFLIGPSNNNAKELYDFNKRIFGFSWNERISLRTNRIENEFYPVFKSIFKEVRMDRIPSKLVFPNKSEFLKYYLASLLFEESVKEAGVTFDVKQISDIEEGAFEISKEMIALRGKKNA